MQARFVLFSLGKPPPSVWWEMCVSVHSPWQYFKVRSTGELRPCNNVGALFRSQLAFTGSNNTPD